MRIPPIDGAFLELLEPHVILSPAQIRKAPHSANAFRQEPGSLPVTSFAEKTWILTNRDV
jgi:hypothetical protein